MKAFALEVEEVLQHYGTDAKEGLSELLVKGNLKKYGENGKKSF